jgi:putative ABC transport system permease protein
MIALRFILVDLRRHWIGSLAVVCLVAGASALGIAVDLQERALRIGSARAAERFDLVIGAPGSDTQLVLSSVFLQPSPLTLLPGSVLARISADPRVAMAAPVGFGDSFNGMPVVGTIAAFVTDGGRAPLAEGRPFGTITEAVVGADSPLVLGDQVKPLHGLAGEGGQTHRELSYAIVGRMAKTGTPWDRAILVPIEGVWTIHGMSHPHEHHADESGGSAEHDHDHDERSGAVSTEPNDPPIGDRHLGPPWTDPPGVPAVIVKAKTIADAYRLRSEYRTKATLAVFPAEVLTRLFATLGDIRLILGAIAFATQGLVGGAIVLVSVVHLSQRRRQLAMLRALGAPRTAIVALVWAELMLLVATGVALGVGLGFLGAKLFAIWLSGASGVVGPVILTGQDLALVLSLLGIAAGIALVPALVAYRRTAASGLRS